MQRTRTRGGTGQARTQARKRRKRRSDHGTGGGGRMQRIGGDRERAIASSGECKCSAAQTHERVKCAGSALAGCSRDASCRWSDAPLIVVFVARVSPVSSSHLSPRCFRRLVAVLCSVAASASVARSPQPNADKEERERERAGAEADTETRGGESKAASKTKREAEGAAPDARTGRMGVFAAAAPRVRYSSRALDSSHIVT